MSSTTTRRPFPPFPDPRPTATPVPPPPPPPDDDDEPTSTSTRTTSRTTTTTTTTTSTSSSTTTTTSTTTSSSTSTTTSVTIRAQVPTQTGSSTDLTRNLGPGSSGDSLTESSSSMLPMILMIAGGLVVLIACIGLAVHFYRKRSSRSSGTNGDTAPTRKIKLPGKPVLRPTPMDPSTPAVTRPNSTFLVPLGSNTEAIPPMPPIPASLHQQIRPPSFHPPPPPNSQPPTLPGRIIPIAALPALGAMDPRALSPRLSYTPTTSSATGLDDDFSLQSLVDAWHSVASHLDAYVRRESNILSSLDRTTGNQAMDLAIVNRVRVQRAERLAALATQVVQQLETGLAVGDLRTFTLEATDVLQRVARVYPDMQLFVPRGGMQVQVDEVEVYHHDDAYGESGSEAGQQVSVRCTVFPGWREARTGRIIVRAKVLTE
ncbi:hypothetical protein BCR44DRAFT_1427494 [Catenaria anguillulae PL171]|uniref:Uncharacterized protein n=1 Tax=Catenaria anguillulae PL171 TaxID=765915 RepID=A0A1Y2HXJ9_9FUNG|nr:hypothetical protein BCR44DRAFT_1427494 [Catenaria anguillulae PL171]